MISAYFIHYIRMSHRLMHNPTMTYLRQPRQAELAKLILRLALSTVFMYHGWLKLHALPDVGMFFGKIGIPAPTAMAILVAIVESFGGVCILLGLATRFWAAGHAIIMIVAILAAKGLSSWMKIELEISLLAMSLSLFFSGAGAWSLDAMLMKKSATEHAAAMPMPKA